MDMSEINHSNLLSEKAPVGLHDFCEVLIGKYFEKSYGILDIACGTGAMARRLLKQGYNNIAANDIDSDSFEAKEVKFTSIDLNTHFSREIGEETFDGIIAMEIIEHLENPLAFLKECRKILKDKGYLLITTPNILCSESLIQWLRRGDFLYFSPEWYKSLRHISMLPNWLLNAELIESGFTIAYSGFTSRLLKRDLSSLRNMLGFSAEKVLDIILRVCGRSKGEATGTNYVVLVMKSNMCEK